MAARMSVTKHQVQWKLPASLFAVFFAASFAVTIPTAYAVDFECNTYSAGNYNEECASPTTSSDNLNSSNTAATSTTADSNSTNDSVPNDSTSQYILLNNYDEYSSSTGKMLEVQVGQVIYFTSNNETYTITIKIITDNYVVVTIAYEPTDITINLGKTVDYDVNKDNSSDIAISYISTSANGANLKFQQLNKTSSSDKPATESINNDTTSTLKLWQIITAVTIFVATLIIILVRRRK